MKLITISILLLASFRGMAQETQPAAPGHPPQLDEETLKKANDPMADVKALNFQNYIVSSMTGTDMQQNQLLVRYAQPIGKVLIRATMPLVTIYQPEQAAKFGLGDLNVFGIYSFPSSPGNKVGIGPSITMPTGTSNMTGTGKWQVGLAALAFFAKSHQIQAGALLQWQTSFAGDEDRADVNMLTSQVFFIWQIGAGYCLRSTGLWSFNLEDEGNYNVPIGLGVGKVIKVGKIVFNIFAEPQFTVMAEGYNQPKFQTFVGFNLQF
ncbi:MAG: hypothetical protein QM762_25345 [Chryseolinea sp.]